MRKPSVGRKIWFSFILNPQVIRQIWVHESFQQISRDLGSLMFLIKINQLHKWRFLQPAYNWKCIKYLQEAFKASELIFTGTRAGVCIGHSGLCVLRAKKITMGHFSSPIGQIGWQTLHFSLSLPKKKTHKAGFDIFQR